ncbi:ABA4-like family protein [Tumidithrix elongata RA019]|uniref:ABA4-like family protein n=1 Tax=Tumidithrix elongata BACA0141 TaxID=2716417 RepID=A0AAW9PT53_9CYAN|nr:ABA4-like family protein [Tumidithrix elongata RA019]
MTIDKLFDLSNLFVLPFWFLMIFLPKWKVTQQIAASFLPFVVLVGLYIYFLVGAITPDSAQALANPNLAQIAGFFADPRAAATGWTHFLVMDLFVGRWVYLEGQRTGVWTTHSILFCLFAGPIGLLSHIITDAVSQKFFKKAETVTSES